MTSVPKPLKFLRPHYDNLKEVYEKLIDKTQKELCSDILSVMAMTMGQKGECLKYRLTGIIILWLQTFVDYFKRFPTLIVIYNKFFLLNRVCSSNW